MACHKSLTKNCSTKYVNFVLCLYKGIGADSYKPHHNNYFLTLANKNLFPWRHLDISSVLLFSKVSAPHKWWQLFPTNKDCNILSHIGMVRPFCGFPMIDGYQVHGLLNFTHVLIVQSHSCIHSVWKILYACCTVIWTPLQKFHSKQGCCWML